VPKAAVCSGLNEPLVITELDLEAPRSGEVSVRMGASGVCHSDRSVQNGTLLGAFPIVLGHEGAGVVEALGANVADLEVGDHVAVSWVPQCGACFFCRRDQRHLCEAGNLPMATGGLLDGTTRFSLDGNPVRQLACSGTFSEESVIPAIALVKIPEDIPLPVAALLGCGVLTGVGAALNTATIRVGDTVAVLGCGGVGLNVIQGSRIARAGRIIAVDTVAAKLAMARDFGATDIVDASRGDPVSAVMALTRQRGADVAFEVIGLRSTIDQAITMTRRGGEAVLVGVPRMDVLVEVAAFFGLVLASKTVKGCWYGSSDVRRDLPELIEHYRHGRLELDRLVTRTIGLDAVNEAFAAMEAGEVARSVIEY